VADTRSHQHPHPPSGVLLGLWHEQSREDRDQFVTIQLHNVTPGMEHNFAQHISDGDDLGPYDYGSIMHYGPLAFSQNGQPTIVPRDPNVTIGQREVLSDHDVRTIQALYCGTQPPTCSGERVDGSVTQAGAWQWEPHGTSYTSGQAGTHAARLDGPTTADFDLYLYQWDGSSWVAVASSTEPQATEAISYQGTPGSYIWGVYAYAGQGTYHLCLTTP
jgi:hypothetical protein